MKEGRKSALIIGAAGGLGRALTASLLAAGYRVYATDLHLPAADMLPEASWSALDITDTASTRQLSATLPSLDLLIYAPGLIEFYPLSEAPLQRTQKLFAVNTLGLLTAVQSFLPQLERSKGRVITISSESVGLHGAFQPYPASKTALEALHATLRQEVQLCGVKMILVRPGPIATPLLDQVKTIRDTIRDDSRYAAAMKNFAGAAERYVGPIRTPEWYAQRIVRIASCRQPRYRYRLNNGWLLRLMRAMPPKMMDRMVRKMLTKK